MELVDQTYEIITPAVMMEWEENQKKTEKSAGGGVPTKLAAAAAKAAADARAAATAAVAAGGDGGNDSSSSSGAGGAAGGAWGRLCLELVWRAARAAGAGQIDATLLLLKKVELNEEDAVDLPLVECFVDAIWFVASQVQALVPKARPRPWHQLALLAKRAAAARLASPALLQTVLPEELVAAAGLQRDAAGLVKKIKKLNTDLVYRQQKYNLLREESEGWAKLAVLLADPPEDAGAAAAHLLQLVGTFDLDPNRALDLALGALEAELASGALTARTAPRHAALLRLFEPAALPHLLGFRLSAARQAQAAGAAAAGAAAEAAEAGAEAGAEAAAGAEGVRGPLRLAAALVAQGLLELPALLAHLEPPLEDLQAQQAAIDARKAEEARKFGVISLTGGGGDGDGEGKGKDDAAPAGEEHAEGELLELLEEALGLRLWGLAARLMDVLEVNGVEAPAHPGVRRALLALLDWHAADVYRAETPYGALDLGAPPAPAAAGAGAAAAAAAGGPGAHGLPGALRRPDGLGAWLRAAEAPLLRLGVWLHASPALHAKVVRLFGAVGARRAELLAAPAEEQRFVRVWRSALLPALSFLTHHGPAAGEAWAALRGLPFGVRYDVYAAWVGDGLEREGLGQKHVEVALAELRCGRRARDVLKRLSKENAKHTGRQLAKVAHANPHVLFNAVLSQIQSYDNLIQPIVDSLRFMTPLALDVLSFSLVAHLNSGRDKMQDDGLFVSQWLAYLSQFVGVLYRKYPSTELHGLLVFLVNRLRSGHSLDLVVLKELLVRVGGVEMPGTELSEKQLHGMAGGEALRAETVAFGVKERAARRAQAALRGALFASGAALPLLLLIAQQRSHILYETATQHLKLMGWLFDTCEEVLSHLVDFLAHPSTLEDYLKVVPSLEALVAEYKLPPALAFLVARPLMRGAVRLRGKKGGEAFQRWHPESPELAAQARALLPEEAWVALTPRLYLAFWSMELYDIFCPEQTYEEEAQRLRSQAEALRNQSSASDREEQAKRKKEAAKLEASAGALIDEKVAQLAHVKKVEDLLRSQRADFFDPVPEEHIAEITDAVIGRCAGPRLALGAADALYTAKFFQRLHALGAPKFSTLQYYDKVFKELTPTLFCSTEHEAAALGAHLDATLAVLKRWRFDEGAYREEAAARPGFCVNFVTEDAPRASHAEFNLVFDKWQTRIGKVAIAALRGGGGGKKKAGGGGYMAARGALLVLSRVIETFPLRRRVCAALLNEVAPFKTDDRPDLRVMANRYWAMLEQRRPQMLDDFGAAPAEKDAKDKKEQGQRRESDGKGKLNPEAKEFTPSKDDKHRKTTVKDVRTDRKRSRSKDPKKNIKGGGEAESAAREAAKKSLAEATKKASESTSGKGDDKKGGKKRERDEEDGRGKESTKKPALSRQSSAKKVTVSSTKKKPSASAKKN